MSDEPSQSDEATSNEPTHAAEPGRTDCARLGAEATPLDHVVDDLESNQFWNKWAVDEMARGRTAEAVADELIASGWSGEDAAEMAENARRQTRHLRGVITRDEVARKSASRYRKRTILRWFTIILTIASALAFVELRGIHDWNAPAPPAEIQTVPTKTSQPVTADTPERKTSISN